MSKHIVWRNKLINVCQNTLYEGTNLLMYVKHVVWGTNLLMYVKTHCMKEKLINVYQNTLYEGTNILMYVKTHCMKEQTH